MEKTFVATGKTIDLAIESALAQLGLDRDSVSVQVLAQAKSGFLGFGASPAKVQVTYEVPDIVEEKPKVALSSASRSNKPKSAPVKAPEQTVMPEKRAVEDKPKAALAEQKKPERRPEKRREAPKQETKQEPKVQKPEQPKEPKTYAPAPAGSVEEKIEQFLAGLLVHMGAKAVPHAWKADDNTYMVELVGDDLGYLIGRRGDTLDAIQHLCNYTINRGVEGHVRINVDAEAYREKREDSLRRYARKKAQQVLKAHRRTTLEPMNAYERHVVHAALQDTPNITTYSTGTEPNRRVVIEYVR